MDLNSLLSWVLISLATISLAVSVSFFVLVRRLYRRICRSRRLTGAVLRSRTILSWGPQHELRKLQLRLKESLDSGQAAVDLARSSQGPLGELPRLFRGIQDESVTLQSQLRLLTSETDPVVLAEALSVAGRRVDQVAGLVRRLRSAVAAGLGELTDDTLTVLRSEVDRELAALRAGVAELRSLNGQSLNGNGGLPDPRRPLPMNTFNRRTES
ncbi:hypothetical protein E3O62_14890 [Cryobacterium sp. TMT2-15-1]|uniref:hypothetical protein n=1 Tax=Cryobacterium sp. TMT2-15-1 TaxID=1259246 RepID=UPI00106ADA60|nr:hypothetical protein [Cryobacterium sp. TMT2-15-1]TFC54794.1 hypothetical protein E3O62_14890 [Cryobacterium sp. TMT2-15-1]